MLREQLLKSAVLVLAAVVGATCCLEEAQSASPGENRAASPAGNAATYVGPDKGKPAIRTADTPVTLAPIFLTSRASPIKTALTLPLPRDPHTSKRCLQRHTRKLRAPPAVSTWITISEISALPQATL